MYFINNSSAHKFWPYINLAGVGGGLATSFYCDSFCIFFFYSELPFLLKKKNKKKVDFM